jgi:hypothetical protein
LVRRPHCLSDPPGRSGRVITFSAEPCWRSVAGKSICGWRSCLRPVPALFPRLFVHKCASSRSTSRCWSIGEDRLQMCSLGHGKLALPRSLLWQIGATRHHVDCGSRVAKHYLAPARFTKPTHAHQVGTSPESPTARLTIGMPERRILPTHRGITSCRQAHREHDDCSLTPEYGAAHSASARMYA